MREENRVAEQESKRVVCGICGILLGAFGVHRFLLDDAKGGVIRIALSFCTFGLGSLIGLVEGIIYLTKSDEEFVATYVTGRKPWF